jgi:UDP-N-acetylmuramate dehydrogenase
MHILPNEPLGPYNSLSLQAQAAAFATIENDTQLRDAMHWAAERELQLIPLGEGSNVVLAGDLDALVVRVASRGIDVLAEEAGQVRLRVAAGENWHTLVEWTLGQGYYGLENLALIPGNVGAAPIQNIGAYGVELRSCVQQVHALRVADGESIALSRDECQFGYRDSIFKQALRDQLVITAVEFTLSRVAQLQTDYPSLASYLEESGTLAATPMDVFNSVVAIRSSKLPNPAIEPNAGSFFKNPVVSGEESQALRDKYPEIPCYPQADGGVKLAAAWMIESCGWKGFRENGIGVHPEHALVLVNYDNDSGEALLSLASEIAATVAETFGQQLVIEPRVYG